MPLAQEDEHMSDEQWQPRDDAPPPLPPQPAPAPPAMGLALASLVLGICAVFLGFLLVGALVGAVGFVLGIAHVQNRPGFRSMAVFGMVLSLVGILISFGIGLLLFQQFRAMQEHFASMIDVEEWIGVETPAYTMTTLDGETVSLEALAGKRVVINIWATWCPPCVKEIPHFQALAEAHPDDIVVIGLSDEDAGTIRRFAEERTMTYPLVSDRSPPTPYGGASVYPTTFFIDRNGVIQRIEPGYLSEERLFKYALEDDYAGEVRQRIDEEELPGEDPETALETAQSL